MADRWQSKQDMLQVCLICFVPFDWFLIFDIITSGHTVVPYDYSKLLLNKLLPIINDYHVFENVKMKA